ncbi:YicC/YloC family endoribonuclease [Ostreiculturibacter nitratireducens]|uniref:YicC/YloC family endoribonuclease n=1 Tax=Ostreiculturibacter nitratireducens TaxID=3075226 RepID=UPI0031B5AABA
MVKVATVSMTGFAAGRGQGAGYSWTWDLRSVNGKGLDLRFRVPDWIEGLEAALRTAISGRIARGNVTLNLKLARDAGGEALRVNRAGLAAAIETLMVVKEAAGRSGLELATPTSAEILTMKGVLEQGAGEEDTAPILAALLADFGRLLGEFEEMRRAEGAELGRIIAAQVGRIADLSAEAKAAADARRPAMEATLKENLARVMAGAAEADPARVAQELALLAVKADVTEEIDRLGAHVVAARALLADPGPVGRKFDFLMQEFMREANTLCSKSGNAELTRIGLDLKHVIDQMREQVQNVE